MHSYSQTQEDSSLLSRQNSKSSLQWRHKGMRIKYAQGHFATAKAATHHSLLHCCKENINLSSVCPFQTSFQQLLDPLCKLLQLSCVSGCLFMSRPLTFSILHSSTGIPVRSSRQLPRRLVTTSSLQPRTHSRLKSTQLTT